ncbi:hypothetical protein MKW92_039253 [Papaver armeniacum]|nr:hypothetical protein MKW92_039253 [Papaver armeniacum]
MIGFEKDLSCHSHLGSIRIPLLFPSPTEPFPRNEKEDGTLELYYLSAYCLPKILLLQLVGAGPVLTLLCGIHSRSALGITSSSEWFHVPSSIGYSFLFVSLFPILVSICLKD